MDISNLLSCHNSSIVPPRLDPLLRSLGLLPSFDDLTFLDKIVLRDTRWRDALGKWMYASVSTTLFSKVWPPPSLLSDIDLNTHLLKILKRPTLRRCSEYRHRTTRRSVAHTSVSQVRVGTTNQNGAGSRKMTGRTWFYLSRIRNVSWKSQCIMCVKGGPEPLKKEINEILGSKREDRLSDPFFWTGTKYQFGSFFVPASTRQFL